MPTSILRPYYLMFRNRFHAQNTSHHNIKRDLLLSLVALLVMACIFIGFILILNSLQNNILFRQIIPGKILELLFYSFFLLLLISNTVSATGNIYTAKNMDLFLYTPVSSFRLYLAKLIETIIETSLMFVIFVVPVGLAYCYSLDIKAGLFLKSITVIIPFLIIPAGLSVVLSTVFVLTASVIWKRGLFLMICILTIGTWALLQILSLLKQIQLEKGGTNAIVQLIGLFDNPNPIWAPSRWAVDLISYHLTGRIESFELKMTLLWTSAFGAIALGYLTFDLFSLKVRSVASSQHVKEESPSGSSNSYQDPFRWIIELVYMHLPINLQYRAIMLKDLTSLVRDRAQALQLLLYLGIALISLVIIEFMSTALNLAPVALQSWYGFLAGVNVLFAGFIITALMTRLVYPSISLEGKAFWIMITAPLELNKILSAKFWCWLPFVVSIVCVLLFAGVLAIEATTPLILASLYTGVCLSIGATGLAIGIGAIFASFEWESPTQISAGFGTLVLLLTSLSLVVVTLIPSSVLLFLAAVPAARIKLGLHITPGVVGLCILLIFIINGLTAHYACKKGAASLMSRELR